MTAIPILNGVYVNTDADFVASYPTNREPVVLETNLSKGFLRPGPGVTQIGTGPGADRGGWVWDGVLYRVMGNQLVTVSHQGIVTELGFIDGSDVCAFDNSFDRLAINGGAKLYYLKDGVLSEVTDPDLGPVIDMMWIDGYFMTTDGADLIVTELNDPTQVDPIKYGSSEESPDPITGLMKLRGEPYAGNRVTTEVFQDIGGNGFPFVVNKSALIEKGCVGPRAKAYIADTYAFVGGGKNESIAVYIVGAGQAGKISSSEIDDELSALTEEELYNITCDVRIDKDEQRLYIHLPSRTLVFYVEASKQSGEKVWSYLASGIQMDEPYAPRNFVWAYGKWICGDAQGRIGYLDYSVSTQFGEVAGWEFDTKLLYNGGSYAILGSIELIGTPGNGGQIFFSSTSDGRTWSQELIISGGAPGQRDYRMQWRPERRFQQWLGLRFRGADSGTNSFARLEADIEGLA